ncbi:TRAP transporter small permease [Parendozoicomonas haliclonae]|uniref:TRAP transporter small permease protein n=1 Tax=Parendozoicomonas haliclonae TaxID=1960125 RepID=A0A1X7ANE2_9GAMM|nr:TRAP transporter small permease [Parendozoicomonas haliclonae]SMA49606.1 Tripartite ATP-independent periplasmic transporter, DctQ component [Parendozoicomonas haliclonae]
MSQQPDDSPSGYRIKCWLDRSLAVLISLNMLALVLVVLWQIISRYCAIPSTFTDELACLQMTCVALLGGAYTFGQKRHLAIDILYGMATGRLKQGLDILIQTGVFLFAAIVLVYGGSQLTLIVMQSGQISPALGIPVSYLYGLLPLSGLFICGYSLLFLLLPEPTNGTDR